MTTATSTAPGPAPRGPDARHHDHEVTTRLRKATGQAAGGLAMYEDGRYCIDVLDQLAAARRALEGAALRILDDHMSGCVLAAVEGGDGAGKVTELLQAVRRYVRSL